MQNLRRSGTLSLNFAFHESRANLRKSGQTGDKTDFKYIIGVINGTNEL